MTPFGAVQSSVINTTDPKAVSKAGAQPSTTTPATPGDLGNETTFLQLLVAQLKFQDPLQPTDGTQFVTQLAQFSGLEQQIGANKNLDAIRQILAASQPAPASTASPTKGVPAA